MRKPKRYIVVRQGGSSGELYAHGPFPNMKEARRYKRSATRASYDTTEPIEMPETFDVDVLQNILNAVGEFR